MIRKLLLLLAIGFATSLQAQAVKEITVSNLASYTDHLSLKKDTRDMDLMVKFVFSEEANTLEVSLISYRSLFVFWDQVRYKGTICWWNSKIRTKKLPYIVQADPDDKFKISRVFKESIPKPRRHHIFNKWFSCDGLQPVQQDYKMVNEYITQKFDIPNKRSDVMLTLRDVFVMDQTSKNKYEIIFGKDFNIKYQIHIQRDPCFGKEEEMKSAMDAQKAVATAYAKLHKKYGSGKVANEESLKIFNEMHDLLVGQYQRHDSISDCPEIKKYWDSYNLYTDSISKMTCVLAGQGEGGTLGGPSTIQPKVLLASVRQIDQLVAAWKSSADMQERRDLAEQCRQLIEKCNKEIGKRRTYTPEQKQAVDMFQKAVRYFNSVCK